MNPVRFQAPRPPTLEEIAPYYALSEAARWYANGGPCHDLLQARLQAYVGRDSHCVLVNNATSGLLVALRQAAGAPVPDRRLVPMPSYTFAATANAVIWAGFEPVLLDVEPEGWHLSGTQLRDFMNQAGEQVAAIVACSTYGAPPPLTLREMWTDSASKWAVPLIVDSAAGFGSRDEVGEPLGCQGDMEVFSFHATKPFAIGEGGAVFSRSEERATELGRLINFGFDERRDLVGLPGINAKLSEIQCAVALATLDRHDRTVTARQEVAARIRAALEPYGYEFQRGGGRAATQFVATLTPTVEARSRLLQLATKAGIELRAYYSVPIHGYSSYRALRREPLPTTHDLTRRIISLPMANDIRADQVEAVIALCISAL